MANKTNQTTFDVKVYFLIPSKYENCNECTENMWDAYNKCSDWDIDPEWIPEKECLKIDPDKKDVFIMEEFKGEVFETLQNFKCTIIGPQCLLSCFLTGESIPEGSTPVLNTAMRGFIVTASGFSGAIKNEIQKKIEYMGGVFTKQLRASVTHLVTNIVMSAKYERAVELGIRIVTIDWLQSVWETNLKESISGSDSIFDKFTCPIFLNLIVTSTSLSKRQKEDIKKIINSHGGEFMGVLDGTKVKVVITSETSSLSEKLKYAMQNNIPCLKVEWVYDSLEAGYSLPFSNYVIKYTQACSTPEKASVQEPFNFSTISVISGENHNMYVDETVASAVTMSSTAMGTTLATENLPTASKISYTTILERLNIIEAKKAGPFLDGCNIYLAGISSNYRDKLNRILNVGSATRLDDISEALTHVIVGDPIKAKHDLQIIKSKALYPYILKIEWLEECMKLQAPAPEDNFLFDGKDSIYPVAPEPPSPLSKKNLQLLQRPKMPAAPLFSEDKSKSIPHTDVHSEIVEQYLQTTNLEPDNSLREILKLPNKDNIENNLSLTTNQTIKDRWSDTSKKNNGTTMQCETRDDSAIPISQESFGSQKILQGLVFIINGFEEDEYTQIITQIHGLGGKIIGRNYSSIPDYGIVPKFGAELKHTVGEVVTDLFIEDCIDNEKLVNVSYYHRPIIIPKNVKPLKNCVIGMSTYSGVERTYLSKLSEALGARYQDTFARKTNLQKNTYSSTHLICPKPQGDKYKAAVKWRLPAVTNEWLIQCAAEMKLLNETSYLVGETMAPGEFNSKNVEVANNKAMFMKPTCEPTSVPEAFSNEEQYFRGTSETPIINKRLKNLINDKTPQSPFHISTPETPYGQMFKENPSPRTRKAWVKWIDHFPDLPMEEPSPKRRRSTPLSEVKRLAWDFVTGRLDSEAAPTAEVSSRLNTLTNGDQEEDEESLINHISTNRKLSFSDDASPNISMKNPAISMQIAKLDEMLQKASNTSETRPSSSIDYGNPYHLESCLPAGSCLVKESQPDSVGWEDPVKRIPPPRRSVLNEDAVTLEDNNSVKEANVKENKSLLIKREIRKPKFMFSGIKDKGIAEKLIKELGGEVSVESAFDETATHLLCLKPARNEKVLSSIAAGKWVLHYLYIEACNDEKKFVNEEEFELGNPKSKGIIPEANSDNEKMIMNAAYRWRIKLLNDPGGAFRHMVALLFTPKEKKEQFERLIHAGGGIVVEAKPPYDSSPRGKKITHCFIQLKQIDQQVDWAMMASKGIMCFPPQFLNDHLMAEYPLNPRDCVLSEFQKYLTLIPK
ncbi:PREDICTED: DNA topoisomerase 2-binding protein 1-A [Ceratosolen solmsi marchali]|uniref:DNA topoisomerase 2-binding protein 1-A n=1 Tax=Ceratosolen solmsi marchali TaxID=326594 RepID=A0AAJ6YH90_9HYME|nr:PREDICTED: DNA topoisomerase 2-binding protein 1-A [Ceratosolen solmsi marchali]